MPAPIKTFADNFLFTFNSNTVFEPEVVGLRSGLVSVLNTTDFSGGLFLANSSLSETGTSGSASSLTSSQSTVLERAASSVELSDGRIVSVWTEEPNPNGGDVRDVYAMVNYPSVAGPFSGTDTLDVQRFLVAGGVNNQMHADVAAGSNGKFAIAYADFNTNTIVLKTFNQNGSPNLTTTVNVTVGIYNNSNTTQNYRPVSIIGLDNGNYVVSWTDVGFQSHFRVMSASGAVVSGELNFGDSSGSEIWTDMISLADGRFVVFGFGGGVGGPAGGSAFSIHNADGSVAVAETVIGTTNGSFNCRTTGAALPDGRFVAIWTDSASEIRGRIFFADGTADGAEFAVNSVTTGVQGRPSVDVMADGRFVVAWETTEDTNNRVKYAIFDPRETGLFTSASDGVDRWQGTAQRDVVLLGAGDDTISGFDGDDVIYGEAGDDTLKGGDNNDTLIGGVGNDLLEGDNGDDNLNGNLGNDTLGGGAGNDILQGEGGDDVIEGGDNNDSVNGGSGNDTLKGGDGIDTLQGEAGDDNLQAGIGDDTLFGQGGIDTMFGEAGIDTMFGGDGNDTMFGQAGNDTMFGENNNDTMLGGDDNDTIFGQTGDDTLNGEAGLDFLSGGVGFDQITGGAGADNFYWDSFTQGADIVSDFSHAEGDKILLDHTAFGVPTGWPLTLGFNFITGAGATSAQATATVMFDTSTNILWYDIDGTGASGRQAIAFLINGGGGITASDIVFS